MNNREPNEEEIEEAAKALLKAVVPILALVAAKASDAAKREERERIFDALEKAMTKHESVFDAEGESEPAPGCMRETGRQCCGGFAMREEMEALRRSSGGA